MQSDYRHKRTAEAAVVMVVVARAAAAWEVVVMAAAAKETAARAAATAAEAEAVAREAAWAAAVEAALAWAAEAMAVAARAVLEAAKDMVGREEPQEARRLRCRQPAQAAPRGNRPRRTRLVLAPQRRG